MLRVFTPRVFTPRVFTLTHAAWDLRRLRSEHNIISEPDRCVHPHNINTDSGVPASSGVEHIFAAAARENTDSRASQLGTQAMSLQRQTTLLRCAAISLHRLMQTLRARLAGTRHATLCLTIDVITARP